MSAPKESGLKRYEVRKVLSTMRIKLCFLAMLETARTSTTCIVGFVGVSVQISWNLHKNALKKDLKR